MLITYWRKRKRKKKRKKKEKKEKRRKGARKKNKEVKEHLLGKAGFRRSDLTQISVETEPLTTFCLTWSKRKGWEKRLEKLFSTFFQQWCFGRWQQQLVILSIIFPPKQCLESSSKFGSGSMASLFLQNTKPSPFCALGYRWNVSIPQKHLI